MRRRTGFLLFFVLSLSIPGFAQLPPLTRIYAVAPGGGRFQESATPEVKKKLDLLTVDVKTVKVPLAAAGSSGPAPVRFRPSKISAGRQKYTTSFMMMGQKMTMSTLRTITASHLNGKKIWRVVDVTTGGMGAGTDTVDIDALTACTVHRAALQGPGVLSLDFGPDGVKGSIKYPGKEKPVDVNFSGPLVSDNAGIDVALSTLPLKEGYRSTLNMFDSSVFEVKPMTVTVTGREMITTEAGSFDALVVEVKPMEGGKGSLKYWIAAGSTRMVRNDSEIPESMGGGVVTTELAK